MLRLILALVSYLQVDANSSQKVSLATKLILKNLNDLRACGEKQGVKASSIISSFKRAAGKEK